MNVAIITGGSSGLGVALCEEFFGRGWQVVEFSRSAPHPYSIALDLSDPQAAARVFGETFTALASRCPREVVAVGCAAVLGPVGPAGAVEARDVVHSIDVNVTAAVLFASRFIHAFQQQDCEKTLVNISSGAAVKTHAGWSLYSAGKAAIEQFVRVLAAEQTLQAAPVRAINVNPGVMDTAMQAEVRSASREDFPELDRFVSLHDEGLLAPPAEVARWVAELVASRPEPGQTYAVRR